VSDSLGIGIEGGPVTGVRQKRVKRSDHLGALPDRGSDPLDRSGTNVTDRKHAGAIRLEWSATTSAVGIRTHEAVVVKRDAVL
jgi:hypothetical protein